MSAILPVEDDLENREMLTQMVTAMGFDVIAAASAEDALRMLDQRNDVALAVCDIRLPGMDGIGFSALARERHPSAEARLRHGRFGSRRRSDSTWFGRFAKARQLHCPDPRHCRSAWRAE